MDDERLEAIERELEKDDHQCEWIGGNAHSHVTGLAYELLEEIHRLRREVNGLDEVYWSDIGTGSGPVGEFVPRYKGDW